MYVKMKDGRKCQQVESRQERFSVTSVPEFQTFKGQKFLEKGKVFLHGSSVLKEKKQFQNELISQECPCALNPKDWPAQGICSFLIILEEKQEEFISLQ